MNRGLLNSCEGEHEHLDLGRIMDLLDASLSFFFIFALYIVYVKINFFYTPDLT